MERLEIPETDIKLTDDLFVKQMVCEKAGTLIEQHVHAYDHITMIAVGSFRVWRDGKILGDYKAPSGVVIEAGRRHMLQALEPGSLLYCIHRTDKAGEIDTIPAESILKHIPGVV